MCATPPPPPPAPPVHLLFSVRKLVCACHSSATSASTFCRMLCSRSDSSAPPTPPRACPYADPSPARAGSGSNTCHRVNMHTHTHTLKLPRDFRLTARACPTQPCPCWMCETPCVNQVTHHSLLQCVLFPVNPNSPPPDTHTHHAHTCQACLQLWWQAEVFSQAGYAGPQALLNLLQQPRLIIPAARGWGGGWRVGWRVG